MLLTKYDPFGELKEFSNRFDSLLRKYEEKSSSLSDFNPVVNTREGEFAYHVEADLPGVKKADIKVSVKGKTLTLSGERKHKDEVNKEDYHRVESSFGKFERTFTLPDGADVENITASNEDGVLEIVIPKLKNEASASKSIDVK